MTHLEYPFSINTNQAVKSQRRITGIPGLHTPGIQTKVRGGTGLVITVAYHDQLSLVQRNVIARFRLVQYVAAGLFDANRAHSYEERGDPSMDALSPHDIHLVVGDISGRFLAYLCVQSAASNSRTSPTPLASDPAVRLHVWPRPEFPSETVFGKIYACHPGLGALPLHVIREMSRLIRVQTSEVRNDPQVPLAVAEILLAAVQLLCNPTFQIEAVVGRMYPAARRTIFSMGIPVAYAPDAPVVEDSFGGASQKRPDKLLWTPASQQPGLFWPFALATSDLLAERRYYDTLDEILALPLPSSEVLHRLRQGRPGEPQRPARYAVVGNWPNGLQWIEPPSADHSDSLSAEFPAVTPHARPQHESA